MDGCKQIEVHANGLKFVAYEGGQGPLVLCLHGFPDHARSFRYQVGPLIEAGYRVVYNPFVRLYHQESATHKGNIPAADFRTSYLYYRDILTQGDPYYNPNLSLFSTFPQLKRKDEPTTLEFVREYLERLAL